MAAQMHASGKDALASDNTWQSLIPSSLGPQWPKLNKWFVTNPVLQSAAQDSVFKAEFMSKRFTSIVDSWCCFFINGQRLFPWL